MNTVTSKQEGVLAIEAELKAKSPVAPVVEQPVERPIADSEQEEQDTPEPETDSETAAPDEGDEGHTGPEDSAPHPDGENAPAHRSKKGAKKRIDELTREKHEERRRAERLEAEIAQLKQQYEQTQQRQQPPPAKTAASKPTLEAHDYDQEAYMEALADWKAEQKLQSFREEIGQANQQRMQQEKVSQFQDRVRQFEKEVPGGWETVLTAPVDATPIMIEAIQESEVGPKMAHYLATNLDEAFRITQLPPLQQAIALGRIESKLTMSKPVASKPSVSKAPAPPPQIKSGAPTGKSVERFGIEDHIAAVQAQRKAKYGY